MKTTSLIENKGDNFPVSENHIFIGVISSSPTVGKMFAKRTEYLSVVKEVKKVVGSLAMLNESKKSTVIIPLKGNIAVDIVEREDCIFLNVCFNGKTNNVGFAGLTDTKGIGYKKFLGKYKKQIPIMLILHCNETHEETLIFLREENSFVNLKETISDMSLTNEE
ncbi:hypothetical protein [Paenibacillus endoradicis]|uniref:hypothetical protein n=1 Tax=Paenibacillus endoradicis TaxID=2972487 RepID=UPI0021599D26|nr:hypothetical protein [Paenibacillus endoradicis]MCR8659310.1 hypothetical protein [Paenibacillus endoradicis]